MFQHFLLTCFNIPLNWHKSRYTEQALKERIALFERFCYPSVVSQSVRNFKWLVYFDENSPLFLRERIEHYRRYENFIPVFGREFSRAYNRSVVLSHLPPGAEYLITTNLDNDDAIRTDFIEKVQEQFSRQRLEVINFLYGYRWFEEKIYLNRYPCNSFGSMIEKIAAHSEDGFKTIFCQEHGKLAHVADIVNVQYKPAWLIVVHGGNIGNKVSGFRQPVSKLIGDFAINGDFQNKENQFNLRLEQTWTGLRYIICRCVKGVTNRLFRRRSCLFFRRI